MPNHEKFNKLRDQKFFDSWRESVPKPHIDAARVAMRKLIDDLESIGPDPDEAKAREAVNACVQRFNEMDDGWITTLEREEICENIFDILDTCEIESDEDWLDDREW